MAFFDMDPDGPFGNLGSAHSRRPKRGGDGFLRAFFGAAILTIILNVLFWGAILALVFYFLNL